MAYQQGIIGFARVPGAADPHKVYALGKGGRAIADAADLMKATGAASVADAWKLAKVQTFTPEQAYAKGIRATGVGAPAATVPKPITIARPPADSLSAANLAAARPKSVSETGRLDVGEGLNVPVTVVPKRPALDEITPEITPEITTPELEGLGERFGIDMQDTGADFNSIKSVFGEGWEPAPIFKQRDLVNQGIYGAVRIAGTTDVYTIGPGGGNFGKGAETAESYKALFGTDIQEGIVGSVSAEQALALGITAEPIMTGNAMVNAYNKRADVRAAIEKAFPGQNALQQGTAANNWLKKWWEDTGKAEMAEQVPLEEDIAVITGDDLVDYYNTRQDVKDAAAEAFPGQNPLQEGTEANEWLKSWWETNGKAEMADEESKGTFTPTVPTEDVAPVAEGSLIDYYNSRQDVQDHMAEHFPGQDPFEKGTEANDWLNGWFENTGKAEMADETSKGTFTPEVTTTDADTIIPDGTSEEKTFMQTMVDKIRELFGIKKTAYSEEAEAQDLAGKSDKITEIQTTMQDRKEYYEGEKTRIANRLASGHVLAAEQATLEGRRIAEMTNLEIREAIAQGNFDRARQLCKDTAKDAYDAAILEIKALEIQGTISKDEKDDLMDMLEFRAGLLTDGFVPLTEEEAATMDSSQYITLPDGSSYLMLPKMSEDELISGMTSDQLESFLKLRAEATKDPDIKGYIDIRDAYDRLNASGMNPTAAGDLALIFNYMKMLDPASVVRESEFATAANSGSIPERIRAQYNKVVAGERLSDVMRKDFMARGAMLYQARKKNYDKAIEFWRKEASLFNLPVDRIIRDYSTPGSDIGSIWDFEDVEGDTNSALLSVAGNTDGSVGGQCGSYVRRITGIRVGDTFASKMAVCDKSIKTPEPGMVFVSKYGTTGHIGIIVSIKNGIATVRDSNWRLDEKILTHTMPVSQMTGFAYVNKLA